MSYTTNIPDPLIKFTRFEPTRTGDDLWLRGSEIGAVSSSAVPSAGSTIRLSDGTGQTYDLEESVGQVVSRIDEAYANNQG